MADEHKQALEDMAEDQRILEQGLETEIKNDLEKAEDSRPPKRPWWKVWARTE